MDLASRVAAKREELKRLRVDTRNVTPTLRDFTSAIATGRRGLSLVVELARATPEDGLLVQQLDVERLAAACDEHGAAAIAVATDAASSGGSPAELALASRAASVPILQRDLILAKEQLYQARACQADATLLQASALQAGEIKLLIDLAAATHVAAPVEVQSAEELKRAASAGARILVIPAFDGQRLSLALADALLPLVPRTSASLVRGPFARPEDCATMRGRADGIWTCAPFMRAADPTAFLTSLVAALEDA
jgi:indole-3-glycerol phosphate synthase